MKPRKKLFVLLILLPLFLGMTTEDGHASGSKEFLGKVINFFLLFGGLAYVLYKPVKMFLDARSQGVSRDLDLARASRKKAEKSLQQARDRLDTLSAEIDKLKKEAEEEALRQKQRILEAARRESVRIKQYAAQETDMLTKAGIRELRGYAAEAACALVRERIQKRMTPETQSSLNDKSIERLEKLYEKSGPGSKIHPGTH